MGTSGVTQLVCVDPALISAAWPHAKHLIRAALEATKLSEFAPLELEVLAGKQLLWLAWGTSIEAAATTQLCDGVCVLTACAGNNRERWLPLLSQIEKYAKDEGCHAMRIFGRKGWHRVLDGYHIEHVVLEKELV